MSFSQGFSKVANGVARATGKPVTFMLCCMVVVAWAASGPDGVRLPG